MLTVDVIESPSEFQLLEKPWNDLLDRYDPGTIFLTHQWIAQYWESFGGGCQPRILIVREGTMIVGAVPLILVTKQWKRFRFRQLELMTDPLSANVRSDFIVPGRREDVIHAVFMHLRRTKREWDACVLSALPEDSYLLSVATRVRRAVRLPSPPPELYWVLHYLNVRGAWDDYLQTHSAHSRHHRRREQAKLRSRGALDITVVDDLDSVEEAVDIFCDLERRSLKQRKADYTTFDSRLRAYYRSLYRRLALIGAAVAGVLRIDGLPVAAILAARYRGVLYTLNDVFDAAYGQGYPGHALREALIQYAWNHGYSQVDFNGYGPHIQRWRTTGRPCHRLTWYSPTLRGYVVYGARQYLRPVLRKTVPASWIGPPPRPGDRGIET